MYKRDIFLNIRFPNIKYHEDEFFTYKILFEMNKVAYVEQPLYMYYKNEDSIMNSRWKYEKRMIVSAVEEQMDYFKRFNFKRAYVKTVKYYERVLRGVIDKLEKFYPECSEINKYKEKLVAIQNDKKKKAKIYLYTVFFVIDKLYDYRLRKRTSRLIN